MDEGAENSCPSQKRRPDKRFGICPYCGKELRLDSHLPRCSLNPSIKISTSSEPVSCSLANKNCHTKEIPNVGANEEDASTNLSGIETSNGNKTSWKFNKEASSLFKIERTKEVDKSQKIEVLKKLLLASASDLENRKDCNKEPLIEVEYVKTEGILTFSSNGNGLNKKALVDLSQGNKNEEVSESLRQGFLSSFSLASRLEMETSEYSENTQSVWSSKGKKLFSILTRPKINEGIRFILKLKDGVTVKKKLIR